MNDKPRFLAITDASELEALTAIGKYRTVHWVLRAGVIWALVDEAFTTWRASRTTHTSTGEDK